MLVIQRPTVEPIDEEQGNRQRFSISPLEPGFGHTLGNSLRRTLLSSIPGAAVTQVRFDNASPVDFVIVGSGTGSAECIKKLVSSGLRVEKVSEEFSTERGRELYWLIHPPRGLRRLLPKGLLVPPRTIDDLAAWSLILQYLGRGRDHFRV